MAAVNPPIAEHETDLLLALLSRLDAQQYICGVLADAAEIRRLLAFYSFRSPQRAERLCAALSSRYRQDILFLYGGAVLLRRQSDSVYLRLEQMLSLLIRIGALRLSRAGILSLSQAQLTQSDGMLLKLIQKETAGG